MYVVLFTSIFALLLTYLESKNKLAGGMKWGFFLLAFLGCIHYDYGNDYLAYYDIYSNITKYPFDLESVLSGDSFKEPGWAILCYLFKNLGGFFMMVAVLNIIQNVLVYKTIKRYVEKKWWPFSVFIYAFTSNLYILGFSMMRQYLVMVIFFACWPLIEKKKSLLALFILFLCSTIHTSALILLPFAFLYYVPVQRSKLWAYGFIFLYIAIWFGGTFINDILSGFMSIEQFSIYDVYTNTEQKVNFSIGYILNQIPFALSLIYLMNDNIPKSVSDRSIAYLSMIAFLIIPFCSIVPLVSRFAYYFIMYQILAFPLIFSNVANTKIRFISILLFVYMTIYNYFAFFYSPIWIDKYSTFKTIFSVL